MMKVLRTGIAPLCALLLLGCETKTETVEIIVQAPPPAPPVSTPVVVNVAASQVDGSFLLAGGAFADSIYQSGDLFFYDQNAQVTVELGNSYDHSYDTMLVNSTYDSIYELFTGGDVPANTWGVVATDNAVNADATINIDVPSATVRAQFLLNGAAFPASVYNHGTFYLQPVGSGELIVLGESHIVNDIVNVIPGDYHVIYSHVQGDQVPANSYARVMSDVAVSGAAALNIDVTSVDVRTAFTYNGAAFPQSQYVHAEFHLVNGADDDVFLGNSFDGPGSISVVAGIYDVEYRHQQGDTIPLNSGTTVSVNLDLTSGGVASADVAGVVLGITPTLNGQPFEVSEYQDGILELHDVINDSYSLLGNTHSPMSGLVVIPGTYDIAYSHETGDAVPQNVRGNVAAGYVIASDQQLNLDITAHSMTGSITIDTAAFPQSQYNTADFLVRGDTTGGDIHLFASHSQDEAAMLLPGTYDVIYSCHNCIDIPFNSYATIIDDFQVNASGVIATNLSSVRVETSATLNGSPFPQSIYQSGLIWGGTDPQDLVELTRTNVATADVILLAGDYRFYYQHQNGEQVPANTWALVDQQTVSAPPN